MKTGETAWILEAVALDSLFDALRRRGRTIHGPTLRDGAIVYEPIDSAEQLPRGWTDEHGPGYYRVRPRQDGAYFGFVVGPHSWKRLLHPPRVRLFRADMTEAGPSITPEPEPGGRLALLGVRACELAAIRIQDKVFLGSGPVNSGYAARREDCLLIAVECTQAGGTCFCVSMNTGPAIDAGFDLALTEVLAGGRHFFLLRAGSEAGAELLADLPLREALEEEAALARAGVERAASSMGRTMQAEGLRELMAENLEHSRWSELASRCLSCANCTMACPTCFCTTVEDVTDLTGDHAERWQTWDSCFNRDFSYLHGGAVRTSTRARYRQWLTHKLGTWHDQFGTSGCVGCGRCISWCPVGIDLTEEVAALRSSERKDP